MSKSDAERKEIKKKIEKRKKEKLARKAEQEKNVKRKEDEKAEHKQKSMEGIFKKAMKDKKPEDLPPQFQGERDWIPTQKQKWPIKKGCRFDIFGQPKVSGI